MIPPFLHIIREYYVSVRRAFRNIQIFLETVEQARGCDIKVRRKKNYQEQTLVRAVKVNLKNRDERKEIKR